MSTYHAGTTALFRPMAEVGKLFIATSLVDAARAAHHGRDAGTFKQAGFGVKSHQLRALSSGQALRQLGHRVAG